MLFDIFSETQKTNFNTNPDPMTNTVSTGNNQLSSVNQTQESMKPVVSLKKAIIKKSS